MPKYTITWKDPDSSCNEVRGYLYNKLSEEDLNKLCKLGYDEYLTVIFDTDDMTATVKGGS